MLGVFVAPEGATGNKEPVSQSFTLNSILMTSEAGDQYQILTDGDNEYSIVNRSQLIYEKIISDDFQNINFTNVTLTFAPTIKVNTKFSTDNVVNLTTTEATYTEPFTITQAKDYYLTIKVQWKNTVNSNEDTSPPTESFEAPSFDMTFGEVE